MFKNHSFRNKIRGNRCTLLEYFRTPIRVVEFPLKKTFLSKSNPVAVPPVLLPSKSPLSLFPPNLSKFPLLSSSFLAKQFIHFSPLFPLPPSIRKATLKGVGGGGREERRRRISPSPLSLSPPPSLQFDPPFIRGISSP